MNNPLISIIVPVYNSQNNIKNLLHCIESQTYQNNEVIIIDDYSLDQTRNILLKEGTLNNQFEIYYNNKNYGAAYTRNKALKIARGDFVCFLDSDDYIDDNYLQSLIDAQTKTDADLVLCDIVVRNTHEKRYRFNFENRNDIIKNPMVASSCGRLIKRELLNDLDYPEGIVNEDVATMIPLVLKSKEIAYCSDCEYNYVSNANSIQNTEFSEKKFDLFKAIEICFERIEKLDIEKKNEIKNIIIANQVNTFLIYKVSEIKGFKRKYHYLKRFNEYNHFQLKENEYFKELVKDRGTVNNKYYNFLTYQVDKKRALIPAVSASLYYLIRNVKHKKSVISKDITLERVIEFAKKQREMNDETGIKISVVIPNYNYERFLLERIYSILNQKVQIFELIILDDYSTDNSISLIKDLTKKLNKYINISYQLNETNSGNVFKQWEKGFEIAKGDYIWICEADDYCNNMFLEKLVKGISSTSKQVSLAYTNTGFINQDGNIVLKNVNSLIDLKHSNHWGKSYLINGIQEIENYSYLNCTIANVSSVLFKNDNYQDYFREARQYKQVGDWSFYLNVMSTGYVLFIKDVCNYYRIHGDNVTSNTKKNNHLQEIKRLYDKINIKYNLDDDKKKNQLIRIEELKREWKV